MVGGIVTEIILLPDRVWLDCVDASEKCNDKSALYVQRNVVSQCIQPGDSLWWQGSVALWTPYGAKRQRGKSGKDFDIQIPRIGNSGASRPEVKKENCEPNN